MKKLFNYVNELESDYQTGTIDIVEGLPFNQHELIKTIEFYSNSRYKDGQQDGKGRDKPFYNIVNGNVDVAIVATDIDTKDIQITADNADDYVMSMVLSRRSYEWMKEVNFAKTLNWMGEVRARYGGVLVKKIEKDGKLDIQVIEWKNSITDPVNILEGVIVETYWVSPAKLQKMSGAYDNVDEALKLVAKGGNNLDKNVPTGNIKLQEITGYMPEYLLTDNIDDTDYVYQKHIIAKDGKKMVHLFGDTAKEGDFKYLPWKRISGRGLGRGIVEEGIEAQVWTNDSVIAEQQAMELSGKVVLETDDPKIDNNILEIDNGHIIRVSDGKKINVLPLLNGALPQFQNMLKKWQAQYDRTTAVTDALRGETPPSGQAFRLQALVTNQSASQFDYRREEWGIFIKEIWQDWVIPYQIKQINKEDSLTAEFSAKELEIIDKAIVSRKTNKVNIERVASGEPMLSPLQQDEFGQLVAQEIGKRGARRTIKFPKNYFKDFKVKVSVKTTGEQKNKQATLDTLSNIFQTVAANPAVLQDPNLREIYGEILELTGIGGYKVSGAEQTTTEGQATPSPVGKTKEAVAKPQSQQ